MPIEDSGKSKPRKKAKQTADTFKGFVNINLGDEDQLLIVGHIEINDLHVLNALEDLTSDGFKVSLTIDARSSSYIATAIGTAAAAPGNIGWALSAFADSLENAVFALHYKMYRLVQTQSLEDFNKPKGNERTFR